MVPNVAIEDNQLSTFGRPDAIENKQINANKIYFSSCKNQYDICTFYRYDYSSDKIETIFESSGLENNFFIESEFLIVISKENYRQSAKIINLKTLEWYDVLSVDQSSADDIRCKIFDKKAICYTMKKDESTFYSYKIHQRQLEQLYKTTGKPRRFIANENIFASSMIAPGRERVVIFNFKNKKTEILQEKSSLFQTDFMFIQQNKRLLVINTPDYTFNDFALFFTSDVYLYDPNQNKKLPVTLPGDIGTYILHTSYRVVPTGVSFNKDETKMLVNIDGNKIEDVSFPVIQ